MKYATLAGGAPLVGRFEVVRTRLLAAPGLVESIALCAIFVALPTVLRLAIDHVVTDAAFVTYYPFVLLAALFMEAPAAALTALASAVVANFLFMQPRHIFFGGIGDTVGATIFLFSCGLTILMANALKRALRDLETSRRREAALNAELRHLNQELGHRVRNTLSMVQALATQTFRGTPENDDAVRAFRGRLHALGEAQSVLTSGQWEVPQLPDLALRALAPFNGQGAVRIEGPACILPQAACIPLVLALHELGTNAVKYGALSTLSGVVSVSWEIRSVRPGGPLALFLEWIERGGPAVAPPTRKGLGSRLLSSQSGLQTVTLEFHGEGVVAQIVIEGAKV